MTKINKQIIKTKANILKSIRDFFGKEGFLEI